jgi:hypothetical protein
MREIMEIGIIETMLSVFCVFLKTSYDTVYE